MRPGGLFETYKSGEKGVRQPFSPASGSRDFLAGRSLRFAPSGDAVNLTASEHQASIRGEAIVEED